MHEKHEKVECEERFNAVRALQEQWPDLVHGFELLEALLDGRLALVSFQYLSGSEVASVGQQRIHPVALSS
jgi:hypothetical protein